MSKLYCPTCGDSREKAEFLPDELPPVGQPLCYRCLVQHGQRVPLKYARTLKKARGAA